MAMAMDGNVGLTPPASEVVPPPIIRGLVDKAVYCVANFGEACEESIKKKQAGNAMFGFLYASDPYHAYYQHCLAEACVKYHFQPSTKRASPSPPSSTTA